MQLITLRSGPASLVLAPARGGAVVRYWSETPASTVDWLRPASPDALRKGDPFAMAAFPLVPYSNRIRGGRFHHEGRAIALPLNHPPERHSLHGHGWQSAWEVRSVTSAIAALEYRHLPDAWPWTYRAHQRFVLGPDVLTITLSLTNESEASMPAGLGWHPYFPRIPRTCVTAMVDGMWLTDAGTMPVELVTAAQAPPLSAGIQPDAVALDTCFTGWNRHATVAWPERRRRLDITATPPLGFLVVYTPPARDFFCLEPVSHVIDALNLAANGVRGTGTVALDPGRSLEATITLSPHTDADDRADDEHPAWPA